MSEMSVQLQEMMRQRQEDDAAVAIHVMLDSELDQAHAEALVKEIAGRVIDESSFEYLANMKIIHCTATLPAIRQLAKLGGVTWIDLDSQAPLEEIMDEH